jgi:hypothetical protein
MGRIMSWLSRFLFPEWLPNAKIVVIGSTILIVGILVAGILTTKPYKPPYKLVIVEKDGRLNIQYPHTVKVWDLPQVREDNGVLSWRDEDGNLHMRMNSSFKSWEVMTNK